MHKMNSSLSRVRWGIIGCGNVTEVKSGPAFNKIANSELVAVMRRNGELAEIMLTVIKCQNGTMTQKS